MNKFIIAFIVCVSMLSGCAMERSASKAADSRACATNYSTEGEFWAGKKFKTFQDFPKTSKAAAFDSLVSVIASSGYQIASSNKESGIISAHQTVTSGQGKTVPLNAVIQDTASGGIHVELIISLSGGVAASADSVQDEFCKMLDSVSQSKTEPAAAPKETVVPPEEAAPKVIKKSKRKLRKAK
ncbi:MAG: hypothetical protein ABL903_00735 [Methylococcales bacterium]